MRLETERLILRPFTREDWDTAYRIAADPDTTKYLYYWGNAGSTPEGDAARFLDRATAVWEKDGITDREYAIILKETGETIGDGSIEILDRHTGEIGWILLPEYRGKGYVTEMGRALLQFGFEKLGLNSIIAHGDARNVKSQNVMKRLGMVQTAIQYGVRPQKDADDAPGDEVTYTITREQYTRAMQRE